MRNLLLCVYTGLLLAALMFGCRPAKPTPRPEAPASAAPVVLALAPADSATPPRQVLRRRVFGLLPTKKRDASTASLREIYGVPRKCKGCTINYVQGDQANNTAAKNAAAGTGATSAAKADAPVASGQGKATDQSGAGAASAIEGNGNAPVLTNTAPPKPTVGTTIAGNLTRPVGYVLGAALAVALVWGVVAWRNRKKAINPLS